jgi:hypothetical protein
VKNAAAPLIPWMNLKTIIAKSTENKWQKGFCDRIPLGISKEKLKSSDNTNEDDKESKEPGPWLAMNQKHDCVQSVL